MEFLAGVLRRPILQVGEIQADNMNSKVLPCPCDSNTKEPLAIMWLRFQPTSVMFNHIAPLIPGSSKLIILLYDTFCNSTL